MQLSPVAPNGGSRFAAWLSCLLTTCYLSVVCRHSTPLHSAAFQGHEQICALLVACGADVNQRDCDGETPLDIAVDSPRALDAIYAAMPAQNVLPAHTPRL
jgi:hypothetical protein